MFQTNLLHAIVKHTKKLIHSSLYWESKNNTNSFTNTILYTTYVVYTDMSSQTTLHYIIHVDLSSENADLNKL